MINSIISVIVGAIIGVFVGKRIERQVSINQSKKTVRAFLEMFISRWKKLDDFSINIAMQSDIDSVVDEFDRGIKEIGDIGKILLGLTKEYATYLPKQASNINQIASEIEGLKDNSSRIRNALINEHRGLPEDDYLYHISNLVERAEELLKGSVES
ncbi:MAG: hypothetical protein KKI07_01045 [Euryarchaeota archaeon]|nr:hypothetical protein [Euryarchaeota archaeon]